ncbi:MULTISPECIES: SseB family protein [unclassified Microbacterium]|uniref:SseB family protein n=1 Tax=unclassified Microbacterium TaxID=2609290 RepID=UPI000EA9C683|nr:MULTISPECIES: SseB family protein [unclassified Microbacterium]MBT2485108.1 SseB family protein [Microbacterium sp. ISL-108]RKN67949.1 SseB family protein [Microbacterium sp. CGR2]
MALFSRRKKSDDDAVAQAADTTVGAASEQGPAAEAVETAPSVGISVQAFRGVGEDAGPEVTLPDPDAPAPATAAAARPAAPQPAPLQPEQTERRLPLGPILPPEQTETVAGMKDNVLLRETLKEIEASATNEQLLGVLRQALQGHLYIRVNGDARAQISEGKPLSVAVVRDDDGRQFMLAFSSAAAVRASVQRESDPTATSAVAQPVTSVLQQVVSGDFAGLIVDNASAPNRVVFPTELLEKALEQADVDMTVKTILATPREQDTAVKLGQVLAQKRMWVAVNDGADTGQVGIAEAQTTDGKRFLQLFSHPLEVLALGRGDRPLPFEPVQLAKVLSSHANMAGVILDSAGPSIIVERDALEPVLVLAVDIDD